MSAEQLAELLSLSQKTIYNNWRKWGLKGYRVGRSLRFKRTEVNRWIEANAL